MMTKRLSFLVAASLLFCSTAVSAQLGDSPGNVRPNDGSFLDRFNSEQLIGNPQLASEAYVLGEAIGRCVVNIAGEKAAKLLGGPNTDDENYRTLGRSMSRRYSACSHGGGAVPPMIVNYGIAEALIKADDNSDLSDRALSVNVDEAGAFQGDSSGAVTMDGIARCLSVYSPGLVKKVIDTNLNSLDQDAALQALYSKTPECGVGQPPSSIPNVLQRGALAVALYQWTHQA